jgi:hypothetical protein
MKNPSTSRRKEKGERRKEKGERRKEKEEMPCTWISNE